MDKEQETKLSLLMRAMIKYDGGDVPRIQHFVKVHDFARMIGVTEDMGSEQLFILEAAAILHDVGIHAAEAKYGNSHGKHQEELGPAEAKKVLAEVGGFRILIDLPMTSGVLVSRQPIPSPRAWDMQRTTFADARAVSSIHSTSSPMMDTSMLPGNS